MKTEMSEDGVITIRPESSVEAYALRQWIGDGRHVEIGDLQTGRIMEASPASLMIDAEWPQAESQKYESPRGVLDFLEQKT